MLLKDIKSFHRLWLQLKKLPGMGPKQAERAVVYLLRTPPAESEELINALREAKTRIRFCSQCWNFAEKSLCLLCLSSERDQGQICVVENPQDVSAIERTGSYRGVYHILHGALSPLEGIGPENLKVKDLLKRVRAPEPKVCEVILATDLDSEGETTALYLSQILKEFPSLKVTRIAQGVPLGGNLDYIDERTLSFALHDRREIL